VDAIDGSLLLRKDVLPILRGYQKPLPESTRDWFPRDSKWPAGVITVSGSFQAAILAVARQEAGANRY
jgi:hypothetical protein